MKKVYVKDLKPENKQFQERFMVKTVEIRDGNAGKTHLYLTLGDNTGEVQAVKWSLDHREKESFKKIETGMVVAVLGKCSEYQGKLQIVLDGIKLAAEGTYDKADFIKAAPESSESMYEYITDKIKEFKDEELKTLCLSFYEERKDKLMYWPAAKMHHHNEYGGLLWHIKRMMMQGERLCEVYTYLNRDLLLAGIALHDIEKVNEIMSDENGVSPDYSLKGKMLGHLVMGVEAIGERCKELMIGEEKTLMLQHMVLAHHYEPDWGSPKRPMFPEAEALHYIDMIDARMFTFEADLEYQEPGTLTEKDFSLHNRQLYKRTW